MPLFLLLLSNLVFAEPQCLVFAERLLVPRDYVVTDKNKNFEISAGLRNERLLITVNSADSAGNSARFNTASELKKIMDQFEGKFKSIEIILGGYQPLDDYDRVRMLDPELKKLNEVMAARRKTEEYQVIKEGRGEQAAEAFALYVGLSNTAIGQILKYGMFTRNDIEVVESHLSPTKDRFLKVKLRFNVPQGR